MKIIRTTSLLIIWPCATLYCMSFALVNSTLVFMVQIKKVWR